MNKTHPNIVNSKLGSKLLTTILLRKNLRNHYKIVEENAKGLLNSNNNPYQYFKQWFVSDTYGLVHGRKRRLVKLGGRIREYFITGDGTGNFVKVYAGTVEDAIMSCPYLSDCIVVPSDTSATPSPVAYIVINEEESINSNQIIEVLKEKNKCLEKFAQPTRYELETKIVRTKAGKKDYGYYKEKSLCRADK